MTPEEFVIAYMEAQMQGLTRKETRELMELSDGAFGSRIRSLKKAGVELPPLAQHERHSKIDAPRLNALIKQMQEAK